MQLWIMVCLAAMLALALTLGAGTRGRELATLALQLTGLAILPAALFRLTSSSNWPDLWPILLCGLILLVPLIQMVPLPADIWTRLPGRALAVETLEIAGVPLSSQPISLTPDATWAAFLWILPAICLFLAALCLNDSRYRRLCILTVGLLVLGVVLAAVQRTTSLSWPTHPFSNDDFPIGFFANKNHQAGALAVGLPMAAAVGDRWRHGTSQFRPLGLVLYLGLTVALLGGIVATSSRAGLILAAIGVVAGGLIYGRSLYQGRLSPGLVGLMAVLILAVASVLAVGGGAVISRFSDSANEERRLDSWPTIFSAAQAAQPVGTGLGSLDVVYRSVENADTMSKRYVNEAHNDYLQLWLETGVFFPLLLLLFIVWLVAAAIRLARAAPTPNVAFLWAALSGVLILLAHSFVDYPMRTQALVCVFALFCSGLARRPSRPTRHRSHGS